MAKLYIDDSKARLTPTRLAGKTTKMEAKFQRMKFASRAADKRRIEGMLSTLEREVDGGNRNLEDRFGDMKREFLNPKRNPFLRQKFFDLWERYNSLKAG